MVADSKTARLWT